MTTKFAAYIALLLILGLFGLLGFNTFQIFTRVNGQYFGVLPTGDKFQVSPLDRPEVSLKALLTWATMAATAANTINFVYYDKTLEDLKLYFTSEGYDSFITALQASGSLSAIIDKKLIVTSVAIGPAIVIAEDEQQGYHIWTIQIPLIVSYLSASEEVKRRKVVVIDVTQVPTTYSPKGIGIKKYSEETPAIEG